MRPGIPALGLVLTVAVVAAVLPSVPGALGLAAPHATLSPTSAVARTTAAPAPSTVARSPATSGNITNVSVSVITSLPTFSVLPLGPVPLSFNISVTNATISPQNVTLWANVTDATTGAICTQLNLSSLVQAPNGTNATYSFNLTMQNVGNLTLDAIACPTIAQDNVEIVVGAWVNGTGAPWNGTYAAHDSNATSTTPGTALVFALPTNSLNFATSATAYTYSLSANYTGQYVGRVQLTIYSAAIVRGNRSVVLSASLIRTGGLPTVVSWYEPKGGNYPYMLQLFTPYANATTSGFLSLTNVTPVYYNSTTYHNQSFLGPLGPAGGGAVLLLVGFVVGAVVAFIAARMTGAPKATPPDPWKPKSEGAAAPNTCSLCGKSFDTPEELTAHSKSEHGVGA